MLTLALHTFANLEQHISEMSNDRALKLCLEFLNQPIALSSRDVIRAASRAIDLARKPLNERAMAEAKYHRGLAHLEIQKELQQPSDLHCLDSQDVDRAITDLDEAYSVFRKMKRRLAEEAAETEQRRLKQMRLRDKARPKIPDTNNGLTISTDALKVSERCVSAALALGWAYSRKNLLAESLRWQQNALKQCDTVTLNVLLAAAHEAIGNTLRLVGDVDHALLHLREAVALRRDLGLPEAIAGTLVSLALAYHVMNDTSAAREYYQQSLEFYRESSARYRMLQDERQEIAVRYHEIAAKIGLAGVCLDRCEYDTALELALHALIAYEEFLSHQGEENAMATIGDIYESIVQVRLTIGRIYRALEQREAAMEQYREAFNLVGVRCPQRVLLPIMLEAGRIHRDLGESGAYLATYQNALELAASLKDKYMQAQLLEELSLAYEAMEQYEQALDSYKKSVGIRNDIADEKRLIATEVSRIQFDAEQKEREAERLNERNAELENELTDFLVNVGLHDDGIHSRHSTASINKPADHRAGKEARAMEKSAAERKWIYFQHRLENLYPGFLTALTRMVPTLTETEVRMCALLRLGLDAQQIRTAFNIVQRTLDTHRSRIRVKLGCESKIDLVTCLLAIAGDSKRNNRDD